MLNTTELKVALASFYGTEQYHRLSFIPGVIATDGVKFLCEKAECFWLFDKIAALQIIPEIAGNPALQEMQFWQMTVNDKSAVLVCCEDEGKPVYEEEISYTDFPLDSIRIWVGYGDGRNKVAMLPSEY